MNLDGAVVIVTGASRGIGQEIAVALGAAGAKVGVVARTAEAPDDGLPGTVSATVDLVRAAGGEALAVIADVGSEDDRLRLVDEVDRGLGAIDGLVNNAALTVPGRPGRRPPRPEPGQKGTMPSFLDLPVEAVRKQFEVNLFACYRLMQLVLPGMLERRRGAIVNISSDASRRPGEGPWPAGSTGGGPWAYGGSKIALEHLTSAVAWEVAPQDVAVNALLPSRPVRTPGVEYFAPGLDAEEPDRFAAATLALLRRPVAEGTGQVLYSEDVLHPELGRRGWLADV